MNQIKENLNDKKGLKETEKEVNKQIDNFGVEMLSKLGVPKLVAKVAIKTNGGLFSPTNLPAMRIAKKVSRKIVARVLHMTKGTTLQQYSDHAINMGKKKTLSYAMGSYGFVNLIFISVLILVAAIVIIIII